MIYPSAVEVLRAILQTHEEVIRPALATTLERSASATISHLLRHVALRIEVEGQLLADDIATARKTLAAVSDYLAALGGGEADARRRAIGELLDRRFRPADVYPTLTSMAEEAGAFRQAVSDSLGYLQGIRSAQAHDPRYQAIRDTVRSYVIEQIRREGELIEPAFAGQGPRR